MKYKSVNWGILGCGDVAEVKSGPAFQKVENSSLVTVMRRNEDKVKDFAKRHHVANWTTSATDLISNKLINAVYIATPPSSHLHYAIQAIQSGKNVYLEKPMVLNVEEAKILLDTLKNSNTKITIAHYRRTLPVFVKVKELIDSNSIGKISSVLIDVKQSKNANLIAKTEVNWRLNPEISGGGYFHDIAPHQIDLMCYYFGEVAYFEKGKKDNLDSKNDMVSGQVQFKNGVRFTGNWNFNATTDNDICTIQGENGSISFSFYGDTIKLNIGAVTTEYNFKNPKHVQQPMIEKTVGYFLGENPNPCSVEEAAIVTEIMDSFTS